jgi:hypothetical protein
LCARAHEELARECRVTQRRSRLKGWTHRKLPGEQRIAQIESGAQRSVLAERLPPPFLAQLEAQARGALAVIVVRPGVTHADHGTRSERGEHVAFVTLEAHREQLAKARERAQIRLRLGQALVRRRETQLAGE